MFGFAVQAWQVSQDRFAQAHTGYSGQQDNRGHPLVLLFAKRLEYSPYLLLVLAIRRAGAYARALLSQRLARTGDPHVLITAQCREGAVNTAQTVLRGSDAEFALLDLLAQVSGVALQRLSIDLARIVVTGSIL
ncbi:hypothetical protein AN403_5114 [Pseudomonas fluorescens]|uniref:Uncharacterized protein n=1 Tax=Pseudomonas fluorescens TaxID=294 RepID=A0A0P8X4J3_PSEFL|nr:hypothetical protein AN403_5114 [Pseudomonas fluorescens]